ncbi:MAG: undecaprenyl-diphosphate phosphatase, partial [Saccharopolyspora rectivirgula]
LSEIPHVFEPSPYGLEPSVAQMVVATLVSGLVGYAVIAWLLRYVERHSVYLFVWYRIVLGLAVYALLGFGVLQP